MTTMRVSFASPPEQDSSTTKLHVVFKKLPKQEEPDQSMEKVSSRPNSLPAIRQRIQPSVDTGFKTLDNRYGNVQTKLSRVAVQLEGVHLRDIPDQTAGDLRPKTAALSVVRSKRPRNMSAPSARFSYDGLDLTGVIRSRLLDDQPPPCRDKREHSSAIAIKRHIRITEERKAARRLQRSQSATLIKFASDLTLDNRKLSREKRGKPWSEETPKYVKPCTVIPGMTKQKSVELKKMLKLEDAWLEERNAEMWAISRVTPTFQPITLVLVSSELYHNSSTEVILALRDSEDILPIIYDHTADTFTEVIGLMKKSLKSVASGIKAERVVILCHGGPGHMFLFKKQIITSGKIRRDSDIKWFWQQVGRLMSKRDSTQTQVLIGGFDMIGAANSGKEFMKDLMSVMKPNKVQVLALPISQKLTDQTQKNMVLSIFTSLDDYYKLLYTDPHDGKDQDLSNC